VESDQHTALFRDVAHRQASPITVAPRRAADRPQHALRPDLSDVPQAVFEDTLLDRNLGARLNVLHRTAATRAVMQPEVRAARRGPQR
jgi:hypothetical protein